MKKYMKPQLVKEEIKLEDIIALSYATSGPGDTGLWENLFS